MKKQSKRKHPFVLVKVDDKTQQEIFVALLQSPKVPEQYAWRWALKKVRDWLRKENISFSEWSSYIIYPVHRFNCCQFDWKKEDVFYDHIHIADCDEAEDTEWVEYFNGGKKSRYSCSIK